MFYNYILDNTKGNFYTSIKPSHHINQYYKELKQLNLDNVINLYSPSKKISRGRNLFDFQPAVWEIINIEKLRELASTELIKPVYNYQKGKLISYLNSYNNQPWTNTWVRMKYNKGRCNGEICWRTTEKESYYKEDRFHYNDVFFGDNNWLHYDVPSSIPQVIHLMNKGTWYGKRVWDELGANYKLHGMRLIFNTTKHSLAKSLYNEARFDRGETGFKNLKKDDILIDSAASIRNRFESIVGPVDHFGKNNTELFIHESNIYLLVLNKLVKAGAKCYEVYDSFYWDKASGITIGQVESWVKECAEYYYAHYDELMANEEKIFIDWKSENCKDRKADRHQNKKVDMWVKRNPGKTNFPRKWSESDLNYAKKLLG